MRKKVISLLVLTATASSTLWAQTKKPLDHTVYDGWKSVAERAITPNGKYLGYAVNPQEGDGELVVEAYDNPKYRKQVARGANLQFTEDNQHAIFRIRAPFQDTRQAKIKKKRPDEMPKDSLGILELGKDSIVRVGRVKTFKMPEKAGGWVAYHLEKPLPDTTKKKAVVIDSAKLQRDLLVKLADSIFRKAVDSVKGKATKELVEAAAEKAAKELIKRAMKDELVWDAEGDEPGGASASAGTELVLRRLSDHKTWSFKNVQDYQFDKKGNYLLFETAKNAKDSTSKGLLILVDLKTTKTDTIFRKCQDCNQFAFDENGTQLAFVAETDSSEKALQKFYRLWYWKFGADSAQVVAGREAVGVRAGYTVSENRQPQFSKDGKKLFFGLAPIQPAKDTTLVDFELARLDIWHYQDDYLQPQQLVQLSQELKRSYLAVYHPDQKKLVALADSLVENVQLVQEGNADWVLGTTTKGNRVEAQWTGRAKQSVFAVSTTDGSKKRIRENSLGNAVASPNGKFVWWYDPALRNYFSYELATDSIRNITKRITLPLYDTEFDMPDFPSQAGIVGWTADDARFLVRDEFDIWSVDPLGKTAPVNITQGWGRKNRTEMQYQPVDNEKRFLNLGDTILLTLFNRQNKFAGYARMIWPATSGMPELLSTGPYSYGSLIKAKQAERYLVQRANPAASELNRTEDLRRFTAITDVASQQKPYVWYTSELIRWKMLDGKMSEGLLYKPDNFDPKKKYPVIFYYYEKNADNLYRHIQPAPSASTVNIAYFTSNGYLVFDPNIYYKDGEPGGSAYNAVMSAVNFLARYPGVDTSRMGLQGQSWGGYQTAFLITRTNKFKAAGAGAPVANMTSAYGGIRWGTGLNRQFQYEKSQSRIGATLWQRQDLYLKNSPLFYADKITTPLLIMHNDADDAVPWYQGIEMFTALRRLNKPVWMLQYNNEAHNLRERKNRKDLSIRLSQFFDHYLKGDKPARWMKEGLPAVDKGRRWATEVVD
jgi:dipeptidyl aminopeptidase/acylaminoacyl peptidase